MFILNIVSHLCCGLYFHFEGSTRALYPSPHPFLGGLQVQPAPDFSVVRISAFAKATADRSHRLLPDRSRRLAAATAYATGTIASDAKHAACYQTGYYMSMISYYYGIRMEWEFERPRRSNDARKVRHHLPASIAPLLLQESGTRKFTRP